MLHRLTLLTILLMMLVAIAAYQPLSVAAQNCSDDAQLVEQTPGPDTVLIAPDASFTVAWTLRNSGDCTWERTYRLLFIKGERMDSPRTLRLRNTVKPGETVTLSLDLIAPSDVDSYSGTWQLRNPGGDNFGPELTLEIQVGESDTSTTEVVLPEVMVFGGMGAGDDSNVLYFCIENGALPNAPTVLVDDESLEYRYTTLYLCSLPEGAEVTVEVTDPEGNTFRRSYTEDAPVVGSDDEGNEYTGTVLQVHLTFLKQAPAGTWVVTVTSEEFSDETTISVPDTDAFESLGDEEYPQIDNVPASPIDPFAAAGGCHYNYMPGQEMVITGAYLPADTLLQLGFYQERLGDGYLVDQVAVQTDAKGTFDISYAAFAEAGIFNLVLLQEVHPEGYAENGEAYDFGFGGGDTAFSCFSVAKEVEEDGIPWRLALASGSLGNSEVLVMDLDTGTGYYPTYTSDRCDASEPAWWPDGEWVLYQSNCIRDDSGEYIEMVAGEDYDLYAVMIDPTYTIPEDEKLLRLTATPDLHETEPDANVDGLIVYRQTPLGASLDESGDLWLLDIFEVTNTALDLTGRAPTWSPDGTRIAFMSDVEGTWQIYVYDLQDDELWLVSEGCVTQCRLPAWSSDGKQIIYHVSVSLTDFTPTAMWIATVEGRGKPRPYLTGEYGRPTWSGEGWIAFQGPGGIYRATPGRRPVVERYLYSDPEIATLWAPAWSR